MTKTGLPYLSWSGLSTKTGLPYLSWSGLSTHTCARTQSMTLPHLDSPSFSFIIEYILSLTELMRMNPCESAGW